MANCMLNRQKVKYTGRIIKFILNLNKLIESTQHEAHRLGATLFTLTAGPSNTSKQPSANTCLFHLIPLNFQQHSKFIF